MLQNGFTVEVDDAYTVTIVIGCEKNVHLWSTKCLRSLLRQRFQPRLNAGRQATSQPREFPPNPGNTASPHLSELPVPEPPLSSVSVMANPAETKGEGCPVYVNFKGKIEANAESEYSTFNTKYRFTGDHGYQTDWTFVSVSRNEPRTVNGRRFIQAPADQSRRHYPGPRREAQDSAVSRLDGVGGPVAKWFEAIRAGELQR